MRVSSWMAPIFIVAATSMCASVGRSGRRAEVAHIDIRSFAFDPKKIEISLGDTVEWLNHDTFTHSAVADGGSFDTGNIPGDERRVFVPRVEGTFDYHCSWHPTMRASVVVK